MVGSARKSPLTHEERPLWWELFRDSFEIALRKDGDAIERSLTGFVRAASEAAWAGIDEYRRAIKGTRP